MTHAAAQSCTSDLISSISNNPPGLEAERLSRPPEDPVHLLLDELPVLLPDGLFPELFGEEVEQTPEAFAVERLKTAGGVNPRPDVR